MTTQEKIALIQSIVAERNNVTVKQLIGRDRHQPLVWIRHVAMWFVRNTTNQVMGRECGRHTLDEVGKAFGNRDHGSVVYACKMVEDQMNIQPKVKAEIEALRAEIMAAMESGITIDRAA